MKFEETEAVNIDCSFKKLSQDNGKGRDGMVYNMS